MVIVRRDLAVIDLSGADRVRFLHGLVTADVKALGAAGGEGKSASDGAPASVKVLPSVYGYVTARDGRIISDLLIVAAADCLRLVLPARTRDTVAGHLRGYVIADRVEIGERADLVVFGLPDEKGAAAALAAGDWTFPGVTVDVVSGDLAGAPGALLVVAAAAVEVVTAGLIERGVAVGSAADHLAWRVAHGVPACGVDFGRGTAGPDDPGHFPQEVGVADAVSYTKGCYLGQEVVARIHYRGGVKRGLRALLIESPSAGSTAAADAVVALVPEAGTSVAFEEREVGRVGSAARLADGSVVALAMLHERAQATGAVVTLADGQRATVLAKAPLAGD